MFESEESATPLLQVAVTWGGGGREQGLMDVTGRRTEAGSLGSLKGGTY